MAVEVHCALCDTGRLPDGAARLWPMYRVNEGDANVAMDRHKRDSGHEAYAISLAPGVVVDVQSAALASRHFGESDQS